MLSAENTVTITKQRRNKMLNYWTPVSPFRKFPFISFKVEDKRHRAFVPSLSGRASIMMSSTTRIIIGNSVRERDPSVSDWCRYNTPIYVIVCCYNGTNIQLKFFIISILDMTAFLSHICHLLSVLCWLTWVGGVCRVVAL